MRSISILVMVHCLVVFAIPVYALTAEEILKLKQHGVSDRTIELMIVSEKEEKKQAESSIRISEDKTGRTYATGKPSSTPLTREEQLNIERAWEMLKDLEIEFEK